MRICDNGICRDATQQEIEELQYKAELEFAADAITDTDRIEALEAAILELAGVVLNGQILCITNQAWQHHTC